MLNSPLIPHGVLLWWQRKTWKSVAHPSDVFFSNNNGFQVLMCHHAVRKDTHAGLQRILRHAMNYGCGSALRCNEYACNEFFGLQWITDAAARSCAMNDGCWYAIVRSEKTHTLACNEFLGVQWITDAAVRSCAMNYGCCYAIVRSEKTHTLACNECFGMQWITGPQWIPSADVPSCGQKRHTRWPATNASACNELRTRYSTRTNPCVLPEKQHIIAPAWNSKQQSDFINYQVL